MSTSNATPANSNVECDKMFGHNEVLTHIIFDSKKTREKAKTIMTYWLLCVSHKNNVSEQYFHTADIKKY